MTEITLIIFFIDLIKLSSLIVTKDNYNIFFVISIIFFVILMIIISIIIIYLIIDIRRYNYTTSGKILKNDLEIKERMLKQHRSYIILCKLLYIFKGGSCIYYHTRMYLFLVKYEFFKWYIYKYSFKNFIKAVIWIKVYQWDIFFQSYYYRIVVYSNTCTMKRTLRLIRERDQEMMIALVKEINEKNPEVGHRFRETEQFQDFLKNNEEYNSNQRIKKLCNKHILMNSKVMPKVNKRINYLRFSNYYRKLSHIFFHYSLSLFWILTTTKIWLTDMKIKLIEPYVKEHSKYLVHHIKENVELGVTKRYTDFLREDPTELPDIIPYSGHPIVMKANSNWKITNSINSIVETGDFKYIYHYRVNTYSNEKWYVNRDNKVWAHFSGKTGYTGIQQEDPYYIKAHWGATLDWNENSLGPTPPQFAPYFVNYRYIGYPERFFDYTIDMMVYVIDYFRYITGISAREPEIFDMCQVEEPLIINFTYLFLVMLFNIWCVLTIIIISRKVQVWVKNHYFYFITMFYFSITYYFGTFLEYVDDDLILSTLLYIIYLPFSFLYSEFYISNINYGFNLALFLL